MSVIQGCAGEVQIYDETGGTWLPVGETINWKMSESCTVLKRKKLGNGCKRQFGSKDKIWSLAAAGYLDYANLGQQQLRSGQKRRFRVFVSHRRDNYYYEGLAIIKTLSRSGDAEGDFARWAIAATGAGDLDAPGLAPLHVRAYPGGAPILYTNGAYIRAKQH